MASAVAVELQSARQLCPVATTATWRSGDLIAESDARILQAAAEDSLTLVTYDVSTIPSLLASWGPRELAHAGVVFIAHGTIRHWDIGGQVAALARLWDIEGQTNWQNVSMFLMRAD